MFQLFGCTGRDRGDLTYFYFSRASSMRCEDGEEYTVEQIDKNYALVTIKDGVTTNTVKTSSKLLMELNTIVDRYKMYRYRGRYVNKMVLDGTNWDFKLKFSDGSETNAGGYMKYPINARDAFAEATALIKDWCSVPDTSKMEYFYYGRFNGMAIYSGEVFSVSTGKDGMVHIDIDEKKPNEKHIVTDYRKIFDELNQIVLENKMYTFKGSYMPEVEILDGDSWRFNVGYVEGENISASGYMAWPDGFREAIGAVKSYFDRWRLMPTRNGKVSAEDAEKFLAGFKNQIDSEMTSFRYERYNYGKSEVFYISKNENFTSLYFRKWGEFHGYDYTCGNPNTLIALKDVVNSEKLAGFPQTPLNKENTKRSRWLLEAHFADGSKIEIVDYIPEEALLDYDASIMGLVENIFEEAIKAVEAKSPEEKGEYSITTYDAKGKAVQKINYSGEGVVLNGIDYDNPLNDF
jgi:hypothetical protein